jgi:polyisoprenoid-binding protein YceI
MAYTRSSLHAHTYKDGVLSRVAHDLRIAVKRFTVHVNGDDVTATFDLTSVSPEGAIVGGRLDPHVLGPKDLKEITNTIETEVLQTTRFREARFSASLQRMGAKLGVRGKLDLHGVVREIEFEARLEGDRLVGEFELRPSEFGIAPYKALLGTLRVRDSVLIVFSIDPTEIEQR